MYQAPRQLYKDVKAKAVPSGTYTIMQLGLNNSRATLQDPRREVGRLPGL